MTPTILQFNTLVDLAAYSRKVHNKGYRINVQQLTLCCKLSREEVEMAQKNFAARMVSSAKVLV